MPPLAAAVVVASLLAGGCSFSYNLGSLTGKDETPATTQKSSVATSPDESVSSASRGFDGAVPTGSDLARTRKAVTEAFTKGATTQSTSWENPATGARGTVTPIISADPPETAGNCRDFLASYVRDGRETWLAGAACRSHGGQWTVERLTPWKQA